MSSSGLLIPSRSTFRAAVHAFASSPSSFQILHSLNSKHAACPPAPLTKLHILDASFNPPTKAHLAIATSALDDDSSDPRSAKRLLLLLATANADKPAQPASFEQRLEMMTILAQDTIRDLDDPRSKEDNGATVRVDIGITKYPYFIDKASAIDESGAYRSDMNGKGPEQVHLIGFDTLLRLLDPKYYPSSRGIGPLEPFFEKCRVRVTMRTDDAWGDMDAQDAFGKALADGMLEEKGGRKEWASRIELVKGIPATKEPVSSTKVRDAARRLDRETLGTLVTEAIKSYILDTRLYADEP